MVAPGRSGLSRIAFARFRWVESPVPELDLRLCPAVACFESRRAASRRLRQASHGFTWRAGKPTYPDFLGGLEKCPTKLGDQGWCTFCAAARRPHKKLTYLVFQARPGICPTPKGIRVGGSSRPSNTEAVGRCLGVCGGLRQAPAADNYLGAFWPQTISVWVSKKGGAT
jgi:hypothetical protein